MIKPQGDRSDRPLVSVGVPVYNGMPWLRRALSSLAAQDYPFLEIIITDNASTDGTSALCEEFAASDARVRYYRGPMNRGPKLNFLEAVARARGQFFFWAAHDDLWEPTFASTLVNCFLTHPDLVLAMTRYDRFNHVTTEWGTVPGEGYPDISGTKTVYQNCLAYLSLGAPELLYGMYHLDTLRKTHWVTIEAFDFNDVCLANELCTLGPIHLVPQVLHHTGVVGPRSLVSFSRSRWPGFNLGYGLYYRKTMRCLVRSPHLTWLQKIRLLACLQGQVARMMYHYEKVPAALRSMVNTLIRLKHRLRGQTAGAGHTPIPATDTR